MLFLKGPKKRLGKSGKPSLRRTAKRRLVVEMFELYVFAVLASMAGVAVIGAHYFMDN
jgi:hypothetical protein